MGTVIADLQHVHYSVDILRITCGYPVDNCFPSSSPLRIPLFLPFHP